MFVLLTMTTDELNLVVATLSLFATIVTAALATIISVIAYRLSYRMARNDLLFEVRAWGDEVVDLLSQGFALCELDPHKDEKAFFSSRHYLIHKASALLDRGRFFFPNFSKDEVGVNKPDAFRGFRPQILDLIKLTYELARSIDYKTPGTNSQRREAFIVIKRHFVSIIQDAVDFRTAPVRPGDYERRLADLKVPILPSWVRGEVDQNVSFGDLRWT